ncbi:unnamed protein product [Dicrocoelium dendriticum]|nr:unnamed protein product [Dicrocoelium dendriticum]
MANSITAPQPFWSSSTERPTAQQWLSCFYSLAEIARLMIQGKLNYRATISGQRHFDSLQVLTKLDLKPVFYSLDRIWGEKPHVFTLRYKFSAMRQQPNETVNEFISRHLTALPDCAYDQILPAQFEEAMLLQALIVGVFDEKARERLLSEDETLLTWEKACDIVRQRANLVHELGTFPSSNRSISHDVNKVYRTNRGHALPRPVQHKEFRCYRCGENHLSPTDCLHIHSLCRLCGKMGHIQEVCLSKRKSLVQEQSKATNCITDALHQNWINTTTVFNRTITAEKPFVVSVQANEQPVEFEIVTGSAVNLIRPDALSQLPSCVHRTCSCDLTRGRW